MCACPRFNRCSKIYNLSLFETCLVGLVPDSQRYFDFHHAPTDVFENVNKRELELGAAAITSMIYLVDKYDFSAPIYNNK